MNRTVTIAAPDTIIFDMTAVNGQEWEVPADIPAATVLKLMKLGEKVQEQDTDSFEQLLDEVIDLFSIKHTEKELKKLRKSLGIRAMNQVIAALYADLGEKKDDIKNAKKEEETQ